MSWRGVEDISDPAGLPVFFVLVRNEPSEEWPSSVTIQVISRVRRITHFFSAEDRVGVGEDDLVVGGISGYPQVHPRTTATVCFLIAVG